MVYTQDFGDAPTLSPVLGGEGLSDAPIFVLLERNSRQAREIPTREGRISPRAFATSPAGHSVDLPRK
jgi:hypothetical protein